MCFKNERISSSSPLLKCKNAWNKIQQTEEAVFAFSKLSMNLWEKKIEMRNIKERKK